MKFPYLCLKISPFSQSRPLFQTFQCHHTFEIPHDRPVHYLSKTCSIPAYERSMSEESGGQQGRNWEPDPSVRSLKVRGHIQVAYIRLETSLFPILLIDVSGAYEREQAEMFCEQLHEMLMLRKRHAMVVNIEDTSIPSLTVRGVIRRFIDEHTKISELDCICAAIVVKSPVVKIGVSALFQLRKTPFPMKAFSNRDAALEWATDRVNDDCLPRYAATPDDSNDFHVSEEY